ncbi:MAG: response regulator [Patescibacteria group bacterium]|jgi:DNA-binding response OmpR family regulator|nr:response regulator [Patescibacteria group bacterium]
MANGKKTILLVEDDNMISAMYKTKFEQANFEVLMADNGADGLELALSNKPDLILLDIIMPQLDGFTVLEKLKADTKTKNISVFLLTNLGTEEDIQKGQELGAKDYLVKANLTPAEVLDKVKKEFK